MNLNKNLKIIHNDLGIDNKLDYLLKEGWDFQVFLVNNQWVYRFPKGDKKNRDLIREKHILDTIRHETNLDVPKCNILNESCIKYPLFQGGEFKKEYFLNMTQFQKGEFIKYIVSFLKKLHSINVNNFADGNKSIDYDPYRIKFRNDIKNKLHNLVSNDKILILQQYIDILFAMEFSQKALVHTDIQDKNIIFDQNTMGIVGIIDFSDARISGIEQDFVHFLDWGEEIFYKIIKGYLGKLDMNFIERVKFLQKKKLVFEILDHHNFINNKEQLIQQINNFSLK